MKTRTEKIFGDVTPESVDQILEAKIKENQWLIDEDIKYVKPLNDLISVIVDLDFIEETITELMEIRFRERKTQNEHSKIIKRALFTNAIVTYARCFNHSKTGGRKSINIDILSKHFPKDTNVYRKDLIKFHKYILNLRNRFVAHADKSIYETVKSNIEFEYDGTKLNSGFGFYSVSVYSFDEVQLNNFLILTKALQIILNEKKQKLTEKVKNEIGDEVLLRIGLPIAKKIDA